MSGHNPHSRVSQPVNSSSWNHLQVPYARQPQLAHMSSDRTLRSSPLIWPNTNPADAFYNYMALTAAAVANSNPKNSLDINPLLPFVRTPANSMPFNSVDLSIPSSSSSLSAVAPTAHTNRNSLTPSPRTQISPVSGSSSSANRFSKHHNDNEDSSSAYNGANNNKLNTDPIAFLHEMSEQLASMRSNRNLTASANFARDSNSYNSDLSNFRNNGGNDKQLQQRTEPMELVKEHPIQQFENESLNQSVHLQQLLGLAVHTQQQQHQAPLTLPPPTTSSITPNLNDLTKMLSIINNTTSPTSPSLLISPKSSSTPSSRQCATDAQSKICPNTSNDDSLDSQSTPCNGGGGNGGGSDDASSSKTRYRRRKPQKTVRMSNELNTMDSVPGPLDNDNRTNAMKHEHSNHASNGLNFPTFHSDANSILTLSNAAGIRPPQTQTQSMDLSHHCGQNPQLFENGLVNYSKSNTSLDLTHTNAIDTAHCNATKDHTAITSTTTAAVATVTATATNTGNLMPPDEMNGLNLFGSVNFSQSLRGAHLTNDIATFPNTDDLVKKVEELVKCNEQNGFADNDFGPMELIKSHANKMISDAYDGTRLSNGLLDSMKMSGDIEHLNNHNNTGTAAKHNGNGLLTEIVQSNPSVTMENQLHESNHDSSRGIDMHSSSAQKILSNGSQIDNNNPNPNTNANRNGKIKAMHLDEKRPNIISHGIGNAMSSEFTGIGPVTDMMYEKMSEELTNNRSNLNETFATNTPQQNNLSSYSSITNGLAKEALSASSSDATPSNPPQSSSSSSSSTSSSTSTSKKKTNNPTNKKNKNNASNRSSSSRAGNKANAGKNGNQKNAKSKDNKSDKKRDINEKKKAKSANDDSSATAAAAASVSSTETLNKFRGPYVHVSRDGTLEVINAPLNEEISEKQNKFKKSYISQRPADRNRVRGLHVSTLSNKYDAITTDVSWMCVFCKLGPHKFGLGDLFGPFLLSTEGEDFQLAQIDPKDDMFGRHHKLTASATKSATTGNASVKKKRKFNQTDTNEMMPSHSNIVIENSVESPALDIFYGMTRANDNSYEVWAHEDCIVWASGVHIIGARVIGLETAVWGSVRHQCSVCKQYGAMLSCLQRSCSDEVHVPCAKRCNWHLDELNFQSRCSEHGNNVPNDDTNTSVKNN